MRAWALLPLAGVIGAAFLAQLGLTSLNVALPSLAIAFHTTSLHAQTVVVAYLAGLTIGLPLAGPFGDRFGRRRALVAGLAVFTAASVAGFFAPTLPLLVLARAVQGLGGAAMATMSVALVVDAFPSGRTGATLGVLSMTSACATMLGPSLGGLLVAAFGWRSLFVLNVPIGILAIVLVAGAFADRAVATRRAGLFNLRLLGDPELTAGLVASLIVAMIMASTLTIGPFVLAEGMHVPLAEMGLVMACGPLVSVVLAVFVGRLSDRIGHRRTTIGALACLACGAVLLTIVVSWHQVLAYIAAIVVLSIGYASFQTPNSAAVMALAPIDRRATVSGLLNLARNIGFILGTIVLGALFAATNAVTAFAAATVLGLLALGITVFPGRHVRSLPDVGTIRRNGGPEPL